MATCHSILPQGLQVSEEQEFRYTFTAERNSRSAMKMVEEPILAYRGDLADPLWVDKEPSTVV